jgi:penicillin-binding protein 1A
MKKSKGKLRNKFIKYSLILLFTFIVLTGLLLGCVYLGVFGTLPNEKELTSINNEEASLVYSADNVIIGKYFAENRTNIKWDDIPKHLKNALIATEDKRFFTHKGFDVISYFRVFFKSILLRDNSGGGSTLTQQLVKNLYGRNRYGILSLPVNKMKEAIIASRLEKIYTKEELLLLYLNSVPFGEDVYGVESAARRFFSKPARKLKVEESAVLVGMLKANTYYNPVLNPNNSRERRNVVLSLMRNEKYLTKQDADSLKKLPLKIKYENANTLPAGYFVQQVKVKTQHLLDSINEANGKDYNLEKDGLRIYTTLNMKVQEFSARAIKNHLAGMQKLLDQELENRKIKKSWLSKQKKLSDNVESDSRKRKVRVFDWNGMQTRNISKFDSLWHYYKMLHASVLITNPKDGAVLTWIGGNNFQMLPFDMVVSHRQIASAFKPILYATALEDEMEPCMYLENTKTTYEGFENWEPENYDRASTADSTVAFWYALTHSMNLPSVDLYFRVGKDKLENTCERLNFPRIRDDAPSIALGTLDLSLYEIVRAYGAFANGGIMSDLYMIRKITDAQGKVLYTAKSAGATQAFDASTSEIMTAILQQVINQGTGAGIRSRFGIQSQLAGKTGTAQNYSDSWFIAYTPNMVIGTWVGASRPDVHFFSSRGSGSALAMPVVASILKNMENTPDLKSKYLTSFQIPEDTYAFLQCEPFHAKGVEGFFNRLFKLKRAEQDTGHVKQKKDVEEEQSIRSFFKNLFKKKDK